MKKLSNSKFNNFLILEIENTDSKNKKIAVLEKDAVLNNYKTCVLRWVL